MKKIFKYFFPVLEEIILIWMVWYCCADVYHSDIVRFANTDFALELSKQINLYFTTISIRWIVIVANAIVYFSYLRYKIYYYMKVNKKKKPTYKYK